MSVRSPVSRVPVCEPMCLVCEDEYMENKIASAELDRRKAIARQTAEKECAPLSKLDAAYAKYTAALANRVAVEEEAEKKVAAACAEEDAAEAEVQGLLQQDVQQEAGPSEVVKGRVELCLGP
jgi:hypothetical protein